MAAKNATQWIGAAEFALDLRRLSTTSEGHILETMHRVAGQLVQPVQSKMPVISGVLTRSVSAIRESRAVAVIAGARYGGWVEFGGKRGRPFVSGGRYLTPTVAASGEQFEREIEKTMQQTIGGFPWKHTQ